MATVPLYLGRVIVKPSSIHGYGVFADQDFFPGELIEECYVIHLDAAVSELGNYTFNVNDKSALPLGFGSIYNHSTIPNASYQYDAIRGVMVFSAKSRIKKGDEIFTSYGKDWFQSRNMQIKQSFRNRFKVLKSVGSVMARFALVLGAMLLLVRYMPY